MTDLHDLGKALRAEMTRRGMSPAAAAEKACVPPMAVRGVLDGRTIPVAHFRRLATWAKDAACQELPRAPIERRARAAPGDVRYQKIKDRVMALEARVEAMERERVRGCALHQPS